VEELDVSILHWLVLRQMLGIDNPQKEATFLEYTRDGVEATERWMLVIATWPS